MGLLSFEDLIDSAPVKVGRLADLGQRESCRPRLLETLAPSNTGLFKLTLTALDFGLSPFHVGAGFLLGVLRHPRSLFAERVDTFRQCPIRSSARSPTTRAS